MAEKEPKESNTGINNPNFRIKTLEELNQNLSQYEGMITYFREDGVIPAPMKSVEELNKVHEKAPIYYGREGEKYGATTSLTETAKNSVKVDEHGIMPEEETSEDEELETAGYSMNGLNAEYLSSLLQEEPEENTGIEDGLSEDELRIQQAIFGGLEEPETSPAKPVKPVVLKQKEPSVGKPETNMSSSPSSNEPMRIGRAALVQRQLENQGKEPEPPRVLSRAEFVKQTAAITAGRNVSSQEEAVIVKEKQQATFGDVVKELMVYAICVLVALVLSVGIVKYVGQKTEVRGNSMNDTLADGEQLIIDKISYRFHEPERYDIVVFPETEKSNYVKRIIGMPGETVSIEEGYIYINGELLADDVYGKEPIAKDKYYRLEQSVTLGENEYFVMGDNRNNSTDSRSVEVGNVTRERMIGRVVFRIWPFPKMGTVK